MKKGIVAGQLSSCSSSRPRTETNCRGQPLCQPAPSVTKMLSRRVLPQISRSVRLTARAASSSAKPSSSVPATEDATQKDVSAWQSPNYPTTWSTSQKPRPLGGSSPRFEQTNMDLQPQPLSAMEMIAKEPIRLVQGRKAVCDGGKWLFWGPLAVREYALGV